MRTEEEVKRLYLSLKNNNSYRPTKERTLALRVLEWVLEEEQPIKNVI